MSESIKTLIQRVNSTKIDEIADAIRSANAFDSLDSEKKPTYKTSLEFVQLMLEELKSLDAAGKIVAADHMKDAFTAIASVLGVTTDGSDVIVARRIIAALQDLTGESSTAASHGSSYLLNEFKKVKSLMEAAEKLTKESVEDANSHAQKYDPALLTQAREAVFSQMSEILNEIANVTGSKMSEKSELSILKEHLEAYMAGKTPLKLDVPGDDETDIAVLLQTVLSGLSATASRDLRMSQHSRILNAALKDFKLADESQDSGRALLTKLASGAEAAEATAFLKSLEVMEKMKETTGGNAYAEVLGAASDGGVSLNTIAITPNVKPVDPNLTALETINASKEVLKKLRTYYAKLLSNDINAINVSIAEIANAVRTGQQQVTHEFRDFVSALKAVENLKFFDGDSIKAEDLMRFYQHPEMRAKRERFISAYGNLLREASKFPTMTSFTAAVKQLHADIPILDKVMESKLNTQINIPRLHLRRMEMSNMAMKRPRKNQKQTIIGGAFGRAKPIPKTISMEDALTSINESIDYAQKRLSTELSANTNSALSDEEYTSMLASEAARMIQEEEVFARTWAAIYSGDVDGKRSEVTLDANETTLAEAFKNKIDATKAAVTANSDDNSEYVDFINRCKLASALRDRQYQSRKQFIEVAQKIDLIAKKFHRDSLSKNDIADLQQQISEIGMAQPTYSLDCANDLSALMASFNTANELGVDVDGKSRLLRAQEHPLDFVKDDIRKLSVGPIALKSERQLRALLSLATRAVSRFKILDLIVAIYAKVAGVDTNVATTIKTKFASYIVYSAFTMGPGVVNADRVVADPDATDRWLEISLASVPVGVNYTKDTVNRMNEFRNTDKLFKMTIKTLMAKILIASRVADVYKNPLSAADRKITPHPMAMVTGGNIGTVRPEVAELYLALPSIAMFYRRLIAGSKDGIVDEDYRFELIPTRDGTVFAKFIEIMWRQDSLNTMGDSDVRALIDAINDIYDHFQGSNRAAVAVAALRVDINSKIAMLTKGEADAVRDHLSSHLQKPGDMNTINPVDATVGSDIINNADDLLGDIDAPSSSITASFGKRPSGEAMFGDLLVRQNAPQYANGLSRGDDATVLKIMKNARAAMVSGSNPAAGRVARFDVQVRRLRNNLMRARPENRYNIAVTFIKNGNVADAENVDERIVLLVDYLYSPIILLNDMTDVAKVIAEAYVNLVTELDTPGKRTQKIVNLAKSSRVPPTIPAVVLFSNAVRNDTVGNKDLFTVANAYNCPIKFTRTGFHIDWSPFKTMASRLYKAAVGSVQRLRSVYSTTPAIIDELTGVAENNNERTLESAREHLIDSFVNNKYGIGVDVLAGMSANTVYAPDALEEEFKVSKTFPEGKYVEEKDSGYEAEKFEVKVSNNKRNFHVFEEIPAYDPNPLKYTAGPRKAIQRYPNLMAGFKDSSIMSDTIRDGMQKVIAGVGNKAGLEYVISALRVPYAKIWYTRSAAFGSKDPRVKLNYLIDATIRLGLSEGRIYSPLLQNFINNAKVAEFSQDENTIKDTSPVEVTNDDADATVHLGNNQFISSTLAAVLKNTMGRGPDASAGTFVVTDRDQLDVIHRRRILRTLPYLQTLAEQLCAYIRNAAAVSDATENTAQRRTYKTLLQICDALIRSLRVGAESLRDQVFFAVDRDAYLESNVREEFRGTNLFTVGVSQIFSDFLNIRQRSIVVDEAVRALYMDKQFSWDLAPSFKNTIEFHNSLRPERSLDIGHAFAVQSAVFDACKYTSKLNVGLVFTNKDYDNENEMNISGFETHLDSRRIENLINHRMLEGKEVLVRDAIRGAGVKNNTKGGALGDDDERDALFQNDPAAIVAAGNAVTENNFAAEVFNNFRMMPVDSSIMTRFIPWANLVNFSLSYDTLVESLIGTNANDSFKAADGSTDANNGRAEKMHLDILTNFWYKFRDRKDSGQFYLLASGDYGMPRAQFVYDVVLDRIAFMSVGINSIDTYKNSVMYSDYSKANRDLYSFSHNGPSKFDLTDANRGLIRVSVNDRLNTRIINSMSTIALMFRLIDMTLSARVRNTKATKLTLSAMVNGNPSGLGPLESVAQTEDNLENEAPVISSGINLSN